MVVVSAGTSGPDKTLRWAGSGPRAVIFYGITPKRVKSVLHGQGRLEKFRAEGQKFRLGPLVSGAPKSSDEQKKRS